MHVLQLSDSIYCALTPGMFVSQSYFMIKPDAHFVECNTCKAEVSRGGKNSKTFNTTNIVNHLKAKHADEYKKYETEKAAEVDNNY